MKITLLLVALCLATGLGSAFRVRPEKRYLLVNRPIIGTFGPREKRVPLPAEVKGQKPVLVPRKGEYVCGNKLCKLTPGVVPEGCNGVCQYPIL